MITFDFDVLDRARQTLSNHDLDCVIVADPCTIAYLSGYAPSFEAGPNPWAGGPDLVLLSHSQLCLIVADAASATYQQGSWTARVVGYPAYTCQYPLGGRGSYLQAVLSSLEELDTGSGHIGFEALWVPAGLQDSVAAAQPRLSWIPADGLFDEIRMIKSLQEMTRLREAVKLGDAMQQAVRDLAVPGACEVEVFSRAKARMESAAGRRIPVRAALRGGCGSADVFAGDPHGYVLQDGDLVLSDLLPQWHGYWSDSCSTTVVGRAPTPAQSRLHRIAREALATGIEGARPGVVAGDLDALIRRVVARHGYDYPHHTGHGIGASLHEAPFIYRDSPTVLREGMVIALEPGVYEPEVGGIRQEVSLLITSGSAEVLSRNALTLA